MKPLSWASTFVVVVPKQATDALDMEGAGGGGVSFTNVLLALQHNFVKTHNAGNHIYGENFKLKLCMCALGTRTKFQLEILTRITISAIHKFRENILESSWKLCETTPSHSSRIVSATHDEWILIFHGGGLQ